jgi:RNA polymerase sigma-70 factor (ECF subfamily)
VTLSEFDKDLLQRCLARSAGSWDDFVDRFLGLVLHVINHTVSSRNVQITSQDVEDYCSEVFLAIIKDDFAVLRRFRGSSSLATYLAVIARRVVVREFVKRKHPRGKPVQTDEDSSDDVSDQAFGFRVRIDPDPTDQQPSAEQRASDREEVLRLLENLNSAEAEIVRLHHLDGLSYREISSQLGIPENSIGPTLSRAREKMRRHGIQV